MPRVRHAELQHGVMVGLRLGFDGQHDFAALGELDGVADEIHDDLAQPAGVAHQGVGTSGRDVTGQLQSLRVGPHGQQFERRREAVGQVERDDVEGELAGLDLREVEDVVDDGQQRLAGRLDDVEVLALLGGEVGLEQRARSCRGRRSAACESRGSCWPGTRSSRGWRARPHPPRVSSPQSGPAQAEDQDHPGG